MSEWGGGYVTDVDLFRWLVPPAVADDDGFGLDHRRLPAAFPAGDDPVQMLELGCGFGYGAMALAASNPSWTVTAVDFNPAHIATAREWAAEAGLTNITFVEGDLSMLGGEPGAARPARDGLRHHARRLELGPAGGAKRHRPAVGTESAARRSGAPQL